MARGRKPIPTQLKAAAGNGKRDSGGRKLRTDEPKPSAGKPTRPPDLFGEAARAWDRLAKALDQLGLLSDTDADAIALCAQHLGVAADAYAQLNEAAKGGRIGTLVKLPNGWPGPHPQWAVFRQASAQAKTFLAEFGLTPSARSRVKAPPAGETAPDPFGFADLGAAIAPQKASKKSA